MARYIRRYPNTDTLLLLRASHTPALLVFVTRPSILGPTALLPHTHLCFACVCDQAVNIGPHTPALLVCVTRPSILGLTPALPARHTAACSGGSSHHITRYCLWLCHRLPCFLTHTPALLVFVTRLPCSAMLPHAHTCFACVCDQAVSSGPHLLCLRDRCHHITR